MATKLEKVFKEQIRFLERLEKAKTPEQTRKIHELQLNWFSRLDDDDAYRLLAAMGAKIDLKHNLSPLIPEMSLLDKLRAAFNI